MPETSSTNNKDITDSSAEFEFGALPPRSPPAPDFGGRIRKLAGAIIFVGLAYTFGWYWLGNELIENTQTTISNAALNNIAITCTEAKAKGYPFRIGLSCKKTGFANQTTGLKFEAGAFRSAAQIYEPLKLIAEIDGPLQLSAANIEPLTVNWTIARTSINGIGGLPQRASVEIELAVLAELAIPNVQTGSARLVEFHMRHGENNQIDLASNINGVKFKDSPIFSVSSDAAISGATRFDAAIKSKGKIIELMRGNDGEIRNLNLAFADGGSVTISGPFSFSPDGLLSATLGIRAEKAGALIDNAGKLSAAFGVNMDYLNTLKALAVTDNITLTVTIKDGNAAIGFIPLGTIPPL